MTSLRQASQTPQSADHIGWISITALALGGSNLSLLLFGGLLNGQGTMGFVLLIVGIIASWMALPGWIELVLMHPRRVGGIAACSAVVFGRYSPPLSCLIGVGYWIAWGSGCAFGVNYTATALQNFYPQFSVTAIASFILIILTLLNLTGLKWTARVFVVSSGIGLFLALLAVFIPIFSGNVNWQRAFDFELKSPFQGFFGDFTSIMAAIYLIAFSAPAFENALCYVRDTNDPEKNVPRAAYASALISALYYIIIPIVWLGVLGSGPLSKDSLGTELIPVFSPIITGQTAKLIVLVFTITNFWVLTGGGLAGISRTLAQISQDGFAPEIFGKFSKNGTPRIALIMTFLIVLTMVLFGTPSWLLAGTNLSYLTCICLASVAVWIERRSSPDAPRLYRAPYGTILTGLLGALLWVVSTMFGYQQFGLESVIFGIVFVFSALLIYICRKMINNYKAGTLVFGRSFFDTLHIKLTAAMLSVLSLDAIGYLLAVKNLSEIHSPLVVVLEDIFIIVALLTLAVGLVIPSIIAFSATEISKAADHLAKGTLADFSRAMLALSRGDLEKAKAEINIQPVPQHSEDEIGIMARSFNALQQEVANAATGLQGARRGLIKSRRELKEINIHLEERVIERTKALQAALDDLSATQDQLIDSKRLAALGGLVAGVAHEINTPIGICVTAASQLDTEFKTLSKAVENNELKRQDLLDFLQSGSETVTLIESNLKRGSDLIRSFREIAADNTSEVYRVFPLKSYLEDVILSLKPILKTTKIKVNINCDEELTLTSYPGVIFRIIAILVTNTIVHGYDKDQPGTISIKATTDDSKVTIVYSDDGKGIAAEYFDRVFTPFFTTKRNAGGIGLGLHIAYNSVVKMLQGTITYQSKLGKGTQFTITIPKSLKQSA